MTDNQIIHGEAGKVLRGCEAESFDLVLTDPPYLVNYKDRTGRKVENDNAPGAVLSVFGEVVRVMKNDSYCISFYGWTAAADFTAKWRSLGLRIVGHIVWTKPYASKVGFAKYHHESAFILAKGRPALPHEPISDVQPWEYSGNKNHPTEKAVSTITPLIRSFSKPGDRVLDPFSGSGSTSVAAALLGRHSVGIEMVETYCNHARQRLAGVKKYRMQKLWAA